MRYIIAVSIIISIFFNSKIIAQIPPGYNALGSFEIDLNGNNCYAQADYPTINDVVDNVLTQHLSYSFCTSNCPFQPLPSCTALLLYPDIAVIAINSEWCFTADPEFQWICGPPFVPTDPAPITTTQSNPVDLPFGTTPNPNIDNDGTAQKITTGTYPNPSKGEMQLLLDHQYGPLPENLIVTDWSGKKVQAIQLNLEPHIINKINLDLSDQPGGFYLVTFYSVNGWMQTEKILIQK